MNDDLAIVDNESNTELLDGSGSLDGTRMGVGNWDDGTGDTDDEVVYVRGGQLYSAKPGEQFALCTGRTPSGNCPGSNNYLAQSVAGVADFDGNGTLDIVYVDDSGELVYLDEEEETAEGTGYTVGTADAVSTAADFDGDSDLEVAVVNGNSNVDLVQADGAVETLTTPYDAATKPMGSLDFTGDGVPDVAHENSNNGTVYRYDAINDDTSKVGDSQGDDLTPGPAGIT